MKRLIGYYGRFRYVMRQFSRNKRGGSRLDHMPLHIGRLKMLAGIWSQSQGRHRVDK